jgi:hypothetical protein
VHRTRRYRMTGFSAGKPARQGFEQEGSNFAADSLRMQARDVSDYILW